MLSHEEIQKLFDFTRKKYVRYIDVQVELVDHLASSIEELRSNDPSISFESALQKVYARFPITGFNNLIQEKAKALNAFWWRKLKNYIIDFMTWPKILWFALIFMALFVLSTMVNSNIFFRVIALLSIVIMLFEVAENFLFKKINITKFLSLSTFFGFNFFITIVPFQLIIQSLTSGDFMLVGNTQIFVCVFLTIYFLSLYALFIVFPKQIKMDVLREYGDFISLPN